MHLFDKEVKPRSRRQIALLAALSVTLCGLALGGLVFAMSKQVSINDNGVASKPFTTYQKTSAAILAEQGIALLEGDEVSPPLEEAVPRGGQIVISRAVPVLVINGTEELFKKTAKKTVSDVLDALSIKTGEGIALSVDPRAPVEAGMTIRLTYHREELVSEEEPIPFKVSKKAVTSLKEGETRVVSEGSEGLLKKVYCVYFENNAEIRRELVEETVLTAAAERVVEYGAAPPAKPAVTYTQGTLASRGGEVRYRAVLTAAASAYTIKGRTASGTQTKVGTVAVDPSVIPLGSRLYIEAEDGSWTYGHGVALDTGGSIRGNKIDLYMETNSEAMRFGRRTAKVYILE